MSTEIVLVENLYEMADLCKKLALDAAYPAPFFVMQLIFLDVAGNWEDGLLTVEQAESAQSKLLKPLQALIEATEGATEEEIFSHLNEVVGVYLTMFQ
jgi:hypothetical protein